jgi:hypothetical protein
MYSVGILILHNVSYTAAAAAATAAAAVTAATVAAHHPLQLMTCEKCLMHNRDRALLVCDVHVRSAPVYHTATAVATAALRQATLFTMYAPLLRCLNQIHYALIRISKRSYNSLYTYCTYASSYTNVVELVR